MKMAFKKCILSFGACRKFEDDVLPAVTACSKVCKVILLNHC